MISERDDRSASPQVRHYYTERRRIERERCTAAFTTRYGDRRCDLQAGHDGVHIRNDGCGRPEYHWANTEASPDPSGAASPTRDH